MKRIYLAIPYTGMEEYSYRFSQKVAGYLMSKGYNVYAPIVHGHSIVSSLGKENKIPDTWEYWQKIDFEYINFFSNEVWVIVPGIDRKRLDLVKNSKGVQDEIQYANEIGKRVRFILPNSDCNSLIEFDSLEQLEAMLL